MAPLFLKAEVKQNELGTFIICLTVPSKMKFGERRHLSRLLLDVSALVSIIYDVVRGMNPDGASPFLFLICTI